MDPGKPVKTNNVKPSWKSKDIGLKEKKKKKKHKSDNKLRNSSLDLSLISRSNLSLDEKEKSPNTRVSLINEKNDFGETPLIIAIKHNNGKVAKFLIESGCDINETDGKEKTPLMWAVSRDLCEIVELLIEKGCDINYTMKKNSVQSGTNALFIALERSRRSVFLLIRAGCDIHTRNANGDTVLTLACRNGDKDLVSMIIETDKGVEVEYEDKGCFGVFFM